VHLDVHVGADNAAAEVARLVELGATVLYRVDEPGSRHVTLADPEGNEFCVM
jgi:predicted enzyme related to lactoylglutathione lyase